MAALSGIFELRTAADLAAKMEHDLGRMRANSTDTYAAFDFFVAARHMPEWLFPNNRMAQDSFFAQHVELRICRHLADGGKHFEATHHQHQQVAAVERSNGAWERNFLGWAPGVWGDGLFIKLDPTDAGTKQIGDRISAIQLAEKVMSNVKAAI